VELSSHSLEYTLRPAAATDAVTIRHIISVVHINPTGLNWRRFILATGQQDEVIGCGQVKPHSDGLQELASISVLPPWRGKGVARAIIEHLLEQHPGKLYLTCRSPLGPLYEKFGFVAIQLDDMPPYYQRLSHLVTLINKVFPQPDSLLVMRRG